MLHNAPVEDETMTQKELPMHTRKDRQALQDQEIRARLQRIRHKLLVMSGKGGVGKSSVAAYLAVSLARKGFKVGLMDVDLHGPSIPRLLGIDGNVQPSSEVRKLIPMRPMPNLEVISIEALMGGNKDVATIWRGPIKIGVIRQFISEMDWSDLDYLVIDSPPGTGDEPLTIAQTIPDARGIVVTTPQEISLADVRKSISFCRQVNLPILGIVENMSGLHCPHCGKEIDLFGAHGGEFLAEKEQIPFLGRLPIDPEVVRSGDQGGALRLLGDELPFARAFAQFVEQVIQRVDAAADSQR